MAGKVSMKNNEDEGMERMGECEEGAGSEVRKRDK
jgi:hypothetical protein